MKRDKRAPGRSGLILRLSAWILALVLLTGLTGCRRQQTPAADTGAEEAPTLTVVETPDPGEGTPETGEEAPEAGEETVPLAAFAEVVLPRAEQVLYVEYSRQFPEERCYITADPALISRFLEGIDAASVSEGPQEGNQGQGAGLRLVCRDGTELYLPLDSREPWSGNAFRLIDAESLLAVCAEAETEAETWSEEAADTRNLRNMDDPRVLMLGGSYDRKDAVALYLYAFRTLPDNYLTKKQARKLGWDSGSLERYAPGKNIGGDYFGNYEETLPEDDYRECDIATLGRKSRGPKRIVFTEDCSRIYYTDDHYEHFELLYGEE